ncbi:MAG: dephospho-CoA kinase [Magnetococcus sp. XQGC-1]
MPPAGRLFLLAITGSLGCGKSRVSRWLAERGAHLLDADQDARAVLEPGSSGWQAVVERFGRQILSKTEATPQPAIDRRMLGEIVFRDAQARADLEAIVHPRIFARQAVALSQWQLSTLPGSTALVVSEIPLLFETDSAHRYDWTVAVLCGPAQAARLQMRTGMSQAVQQAVIAQQLPEAEKKWRAQRTIDNSGPWEATLPQMEALWQAARQQLPTNPAWPNHWPESHAEPSPAGVQEK